MPHRDRPPLACIVFLALAGFASIARGQQVQDLEPAEVLEAAYEDALAAAPEDAAALTSTYRARFEDLERSSGAPAARLWLLEHQFAAKTGAPSAADLQARHARLDALVRDSRALKGASLRRFLDLVAGERWVPSEDLVAMATDLARREPRADAAGGVLLAVARNLAPLEAESAAALRQARGLLDQVLERWPRSPVATRARALRWRLDHLSMGAVAPDFLGFDAKGNELRSAHLRGRVVVVQVWSFGHAGSVRRLHEGERLRRDHWDAPFTWLGLNTDPDPQAFRRACEDRDIDWTQHLWEGGERRPATQAWRLDGEPLLVLLDGEGVVRGVNLEPARLEERIASLLTALREKIPSRDTRPEEPAREGD